MDFRIVLEVRNKSGSMERHQSEAFQAATCGDLLKFAGVALWQALGKFARFHSRTLNDTNDGTR